MKLFAKYRTEYPIEAVSDSDYTKILKLKDGDVLEVKTWSQRNYSFLRKYFALMNTSIHHLPESFDQEFHNLDNFRKYVTILTGRYKLIPSLKGEPIPEADSISFDKMDQEEFNKLYSDSLNVILKYFLKGISQEEFEKDIMNFL